MDSHRKAELTAVVKATGSERTSSKAKKKKGTKNYFIGMDAFLYEEWVIYLSLICKWWRDKASLI